MKKNPVKAKFAADKNSMTVHTTILEYLASVQHATTHEIDEAVLNKLGYTEEEKNVYLTDGDHTPHVYAQMGFVRTELKQVGAINHIEKGIWTCGTMSVSEARKAVRKYSASTKTSKKTKLIDYATVFKQSYVSSKYSEHVQIRIFMNKDNIIRKLSKGMSFDDAITMYL